MRALKLVGLLFLLGLIGLSSSGSNNLAGSRGMEFTVCPQGPPICDFSKIQDAIDAAPEGITIRIGEGAYVESLIIRKSLRLIGAGQEKVFLKPPLPQKPMEPVLSIRIKATEEPIQVWVEGLSIGELDTVPSNPEERGWAGIHIEGWAQVILRRLTISDYTVGLFVAVWRREEEFPPVFLKPQVIIHEAKISHNFFGISTSSLIHPIHIRRTTIAKNEVGIFGGEFLVEESTITKNRKAGIWASLFPSWLEQSAVHIENNLISENGVGVLLFAGLPLTPPPEPKPGDVKPLAMISFNRIAANLGYGVAILTAKCPVPELEQIGESSPIRVEGGGNEMRDNGKGDLCPADYPWPPGFKKP